MVSPIARTPHGRVLRALLSAAVAAALVGLCAPRLASAQGSTGSARMEALGGSGTMLARGAQALAANPALLAAPDRPSLSIALPAVSVGASSSPLRFSDITRYDGAVVPHEVAESWLQRITAAGELRATANAAAELLGISVGPFAMGLSGVGEASLAIPPELAELILFGNAGRTGEPRDMSIAGGGGRTWYAGVLALGYARTLPWRITGDPRESLSVGLAAKLVLSPYMAAMIPPRGQVSASPVESDLTVPLLVFEEGKRGTPGATGYALDLGAAWRSGPLALGITVHDLVSTLRYRLTSARVYTATALVSEHSTRARTTKGLPLSDPGVDDATRARAHELARRARFTPTLRLSAAHSTTPWLTLTTDATAHRTSPDALTLLPSLTLSLGAELLPLSFLPLRAGIRVGARSPTLHAGVGLRIRGVEVDGAVGEGGGGVGVAILVGGR